MLSSTSATTKRLDGLFVTGEVLVKDLKLKRRPLTKAEAVVPPSVGALLELEPFSVLNDDALRQKLVTSL